MQTPSLITKDNDEFIDVGPKAKIPRIGGREFEGEANTFLKAHHLTFVLG
jgi:hypothetical protein